jgi:acyl-CoA reductase-like NAD-dependent aldehyde dehydrogenase
MGPLVTKQHLAKVHGYIDTGVAEGARLVVDGRDFHHQGNKNGYFIGGSLFDNVTTSMRIYQEEIFGPVLVVTRADSFDNALRITNEHPLGNGTAIFTREGDAVLHETTKRNGSLGGCLVDRPFCLPSRARGVRAAVPSKSASLRPNTLSMVWTNQ